MSQISAKGSIGECHDEGKGEVDVEVEIDIDGDFVGTVSIGAKERGTTGELRAAGTVR